MSESHHEKMARKKAARAMRPGSIMAHPRPDDVEPVMTNTMPIESTATPDRRRVLMIDSPYSMASVAAAMLAAGLGGRHG